MPFLIHYLLLEGFINLTINFYKNKDKLSLDIQFDVHKKCKYKILFFREKGFIVFKALDDAHKLLDTMKISILDFNTMKKYGTLIEA